MVYGIKFYPVGATTNSQDGVTDIFGRCLLVLEEMIKHNLPLLVNNSFSFWEKKGKLEIATIDILIYPSGAWGSDRPGC